MKVHIGGPLPIRFQMNGLMLSGVVFGLLGAAIWALAHFEVLPSDGPWVDVSIGTTLLGIALYFLGRIVDLVAYLRRNR